jgi:hypothetical protein
MKAKGSATATLADVKLVLSAPVHQQTKRKHYEKAEIAFLLAQQKFRDRATSATWAATVAAGRRLHAEYERLRQAQAEREREGAASRAATDEGGQA